MDRDALDEVGKKTVLDIEVKAAIINSLLPLLTESERQALKTLASSLEPFKEEAELLILESINSKGE